jgi:hypothetical protein
MKRLSTMALRVLLGLAAVAGITAFATCVWFFLHMPRASANPDSFIIIETFASSNQATPLAKIYLEAPSSASDLRFEGASLKFQFTGVPHEQVSVPLKGVIVSGSGLIVFGTTKIIVDDGVVALNGRRLCGSGNVLLGTPSFEVRGNYKRPGPVEVVLSRDGWYFEGYIHLGGQRLLTSSLTTTAARRRKWSGRTRRVMRGTSRTA